MPLRRQSGKSFSNNSSNEAYENAEPGSAFTTPTFSSRSSAPVVALRLPPAAYSDDADH